MEPSLKKCSLKETIGMQIPDLLTQLQPNLVIQGFEITLLILG